MTGDISTWFRDKKITLMGLGLLGRGVGDAAFLASRGARLTVTDLKSEKALADSVKKLKKYKNIEFVLGRHRMSDFTHADMVIKAAGVPLDSIFIKAARNAGVKISMSTALFVKLLPRGVSVIGVTGTRGKSTTAHLLYEILRAYTRRVYVGGNVRGVSTLALLSKVKSGDVVVLELDSWQLQGFGYEKISPNIAVCTNFLPDHMNYYNGSMARYWKDKKNIFEYQTDEGVVIAGREVAPRVRKDVLSRGRHKESVVIPHALPKNWSLKIPGEHNRANASCAVAVARQCGVSQRDIKRVVVSFGGVPGRLEMARTVQGINIYNDTTATTPYAAATALKVVGNSRKKNVVLIAGGSDKALDTKPLEKAIRKYCTALVVLPGTGTEKLTNNLRLKTDTIIQTDTLAVALKRAFNEARRGDVVLFSPGFASFGLFKNEFDRGEVYMHLVKKIK